ncbi:hypothetical protein [Ferroacidibacillus organovorans]|uniref:Uncharacterized protein n=1 Tax=Ferroacidibacillus organovorans TaxID=1765683 RepID=A0A101XT62_9BACL|nr:hypothetical protein [Ferroacidibacillus organovorans]KUO97127.1 hypothetical protein ATW55_12525 [Ferroacidibacillus organovorans]
MKQKGQKRCGDRVDEQELHTMVDEDARLEIVWRRETGPDWDALALRCARLVVRFESPGVTKT